MFKASGFLIILLCVFLVGCKSRMTSDFTQSSKTNLKKAAAFNTQLGLGYLKQGDRPRAKEKLLKALEQAPADADVNAAVAYYFEQTQELDRASSYYVKALTLSASAGAQLNNYGAFLCRQGDYLRAESYFLKAVKDMQYINTAAAYENAGLCILEIPDYEKAVRYFSAALNQDPTRLESLYEVVKIEKNRGNWYAALKHLQQHPDLVATNKSLLVLALGLANQTGNAKLADYYQQALNTL